MSFYGRYMHEGIPSLVLCTNENTWYLNPIWPCPSVEAAWRLKHIRRPNYSPESPYLGCRVDQTAPSKLWLVPSRTWIIEWDLEFFIVVNDGWPRFEALNIKCRGSSVLLSDTFPITVVYIASEVSVPDLYRFYCDFMPFWNLYMIYIKIIYFHRTRFCGLIVLNFDE